MIKSYQIFVCKNTIKKYFIFTLVLFGGILLAGIINRTASEESVKRFSEATAFLMGGIMFPVSSLVGLSAIYNANLTDQSYGYSYFHSLNDSARHFGNAIVFGNIVAFIKILLLGIIMITGFPLFNAVFLISFMLFGIGFMNLFGFVRSTLARILPFACLGGLVGAFYAASDDIPQGDFSLFLIILTMIAIGVYFLGLLNALMGAKTAWQKEGKNEKALKKSQACAVSCDKESSVYERTEKRILKKQKQSGIGIIIKSLLRIPKTAFFFMGIFALGGVVLPYVAHVDIGSDEYLFPKICIFFPCAELTELLAIMFLRDFISNKWIRSAAIAKELFTRSLPACIAVSTAGLSTLLMGAYFVFLNSINAQAGQYSDTLVLGAVILGSLLFFSPILIQTLVGTATMMYAAFLSIAALILLVGDERKMFGFGVPLNFAVIMFLLAVVLGTVWCFFYCSYKYKKSDCKLFKQP